MPLAAAPEVGDLAVVVVACVAILALFGARIFAQLLTGMFRFVPFIGGWVADHLLEHAVDAINWALGAIVGALPPLVGFLWRPVAWFIQLTGDLAGAVWAAGEAVQRLVFHTLPDLERRAIGYVADGVARAEGWASGEILQAEHWTADQFASAYSYVDGRVVAVEHWAGGEIAQAVTYVDGRVAQLGSWAQGEFAAGRHYVDGQVAAVEGWAGGELSQLRGWAAAQFATVEAAIANDIGVIEQGARALASGAEARAIAFATAATAGVAAEVGVVERTLDDFLRRCGDPMCRNLGPLSDLIGLLEGAGAIGMLVALAAEATHDPEGTAAELVDVLGGAARGAASSIGALL